ncbi:MAG: CoA-binding protein [Thermoleophilia bacterium]
MATDYMSFWDNGSFAVVGNTGKKRFPTVTYKKLKEQGKTVYPVDPLADSIDGDPVYRDLSSLPEAVEAIVLEVPADESEEWVGRAADAGIADIWIHQRCDTPEALSLAREKGISPRHGTCALMYLTRGLSLHAFHGWINRRLGRF